MSGIEVIGLVAGLVPLAVNVYLVAFGAGSDYRTRRFGRWTGFFVHLCPGIVDTDALKEAHLDINTWTDDEVLAWKASHLTSCNAIAVAGAIFASIGLTALQLPNMNRVNWAVRACMVCSMVLGVLSVTTATSQHQSIGMLNSAVKIRLWLSRGRPESKSKILEDNALLRFLSWSRGRLVVSLRILGIAAGRQGGESNGRQTGAKETKYTGHPIFETLPLESSISALKAVALPRYLLKMAVVVFLTGVGLYEILLWTGDIDVDGIAARNIFIAFIATVGAYGVYDGLVHVRQIGNQQKIEDEFDVTARGELRHQDPLEKLRQLQKELDSVQQRMRLARTKIQQTQDSLHAWKSSDEAQAQAQDTDAGDIVMATQAAEKEWDAETEYPTLETNRVMRHPRYHNEHTNIGTGAEPGGGDDRHV